MLPKPFKFFNAFQDINDNIPQFSNSSYTFSVKEGQKGIYLHQALCCDHRVEAEN